MFAAVACAPFANLCAQLTEFVREATVASESLGAQQADFDAVATTSGAIVMTLGTGHFMQTNFTGYRALQACLDTGLVFDHFSFPDFSWVGRRSIPPIHSIRENPLRERELAANRVPPVQKKAVRFPASYAHEMIGMRPFRSF